MNIQRMYKSDNIHTIEIVLNTDYLCGFKYLNNCEFIWYIAYGFEIISYNFYSHIALEYKGCFNFE